MHTEDTSRGEIPTEATAQNINEEKLQKAELLHGKYISELSAYKASVIRAAEKRKAAEEEEVTRLRLKKIRDFLETETEEDK